MLLFTPERVLITIMVMIDHPARLPLASACSHAGPPQVSVWWGFQQQTDLKLLSCVDAIAPRRDSSLRYKRVTALSH